MKNIEMEVKENILTIKIDLDREFGPSKSGKTTIIATTSGNISLPDNEDIKLGLNCYKKV
jgi:ABC-type molybdate transport system ATPase subunit